MARTHWDTKIFHLAIKKKKRKKKIQERPLCGLLANINIAAANMGQSVICVWDGWAFVWQEGLRNRSCWQHVGAELRAGRMAWITERDREVTTAHCVSPSVGWEGQFTAGTRDTGLFWPALDHLWRGHFHALPIEGTPSHFRCYLHSHQEKQLNTDTIFYCLTMSCWTDIIPFNKPDSLTLQKSKTNDSMQT